jgi:hypothetical protein
MRKFRRRLCTTKGKNMKKCIFFSITALLAFTEFCRAESEQEHIHNIWERKTLTDGFFGSNEFLSDTVLYGRTKNNKVN